MRDVAVFAKIILATKPVDFRKQAHGLSIVVKESLGLQPFDAKSLFVFVNRKRSSLRMLYWDLTGFATWSKVLEQDKFKWPRHADDLKFSVSPRQLKWLLQGVDIERIKMHSPVEFERTI
jgi:transposase